MSSNREVDLTENTENRFEEIYSVFSENLSECDTIVQLCNHIDDRENLPPKQKQYLLFTFLPRFTIRILRATVLDEVLTSKFVDFFKRVVEIALDEIPKQSPIYDDLLVAVLDLNSKFYHTSLEYSSDDIDETNSYAQIPKLSFRSKNRSYFDVIDHLGKIKGFERMMSQMTTPDCPVSVIASYLTSIKNMRNHDYINNEKFESLVKQIVSDVVPVIRDLSIEQLKAAKKTDYEVMLTSFTEILQKSKIDKMEGSEIAEKLCLDLAIKCLKSGSLEKRVNALNNACTIIQGLEKGHSSNVRWITKDYMLSWLIDNNIIDNVFGESNHLHLIKNSKKIIQFLAENDKLDKQSLDLIWSCAMNSHESLSKETFTLISEVYQSLKQEYKEYLLSNIKSLSIDQYTQDIVHYLLELSKVSGNNNEYLEILWSIFISEEASEGIVKCAYQSFISIINSTLFPVHRDNITMKILNWIRDEKNREKVMSYNLLRTIIIIIAQSKESAHLRKMIRSLEEKIQLLQFLLGEFVSFKEICKEKLSSIPVNEDRDEYLKNNPFPYRNSYIEEIKSRFHLIYALLINLDLQINEEHIVNLMWDQFYVNSLSKEEKFEAIMWFNVLQYKPQNNTSSFTKSIIPYIFKNFISNIDPNIMTTAIYNCFHKFFYESNAILKNISWGNENDKDDLSVDVHPSQLLGEQNLWSIQLTCPNQDVVDLAVELLNNIYDRVSSKITSDMKGYYLTKCLEFMSTSASKLKTDTDSDNTNLLKLQIKRSLSCILKVLEKSKAYDISSVTLVTKGNPLTLNIKLFYSKENQLKEFNTVLETHSTEIISHIISQIKTICHKHLSDMNISNGQLVFSPDLEASSGKLVKDLKLNDYDQIVIQRNNTYDDRLTYLKSRRISRYNLSKPQTREEAINKLIEYTGINRKEAIRALQKWDNQYERALSNLIDEDNKSKFLEECKKYIDYGNEPSEFIKSVKAQYEEFFSDVSESINDPGHPISILQSQENFTKFFDILSINDSDIIESTWNIIKRLPTSKKIRDSLINKAENSPLDWESLLPNDTFRLLYELQALEQILFPHNVADLDEKVSLIKEQFIKTKGYSRLIYLSSMIVNSFHEGSNSESAITYKEQVIALSLKILDLCCDLLEEPTILDSLKSLLQSLFSYSSQIRNSDIILYTLRISHRLLNKQVSLEELFTDFENQAYNLVLKCEHQEVRRNAVNQMYRISLSSSKFRDALLECLIKHKPSDDESLSFEQYFWLFQRLLEIKLENIDDINLFSETLNSLKEYSIDIIMNRKVNEVSIHSPTDWILCGTMNVLATIFKYWPDKEYLDLPLVEYLFNNSLFTIKKINGSPFPKCKTTKSREACYNLLIQLATLNEANYRYLLGLLMSSHHKKFYELKSWKYHPENHDKSSVGYVGISNMGETCYMNSLLQQFFMIPGLRNDILKLKIELDENSIVYQLQKMFGYLQESEKMTYNPIEFCKVYLESESSFEDQQQDVNEFFNILCQRVESQLEGTGDEKIFHKYFVGKLSNEIRSIDPNISFVSEREEDFFIIPLDIISRDNMSGALDLFTKKEILQGDNQYYYEELDIKVNATRRCSFKTLPDTLVFQLLRFDYDVNTNRRKKLDNYFNFPTVIDMKPWTSEGLLEKEQGKKVDSSDDYIYTLCGIIIHMGNAENGHYYSIIKEREHPYRWLQFNDHSVTEYNFEKVPEDCFGGVSTALVWDPWRSRYIRKEIYNDKNAYMLFYERVKKSPTDQSNNQSKVDNTNFELIDNVPKYVYDSVWKENAAYLRDRLIFDPSYFNFLLNFTKLKFESPSDISVYETYHHTIHNGLRFVVEYLSHAKENESITRWFSLLSLCYSNSVTSCLSFIEYAKENNIIRKLLLECPHEIIRIEFGLLLVTIFKTLIQNNVACYSEEEEKVSAEYVLFKMIFDLFEISRPNWKQFKQYFAVIRDYALLGTDQRRMLLNFNIIEEYRDYFGGFRTKNRKNRASVMDSSNFPDMVEFHDTIAIVLRGCKINDDIPPTCLEGELIEIQESLVDPLLLKEFLQSFMQMDYNVKAVSEIITHISYFSSRIHNIVMDTLMELFERGDVNEHIIEKHMESMILMEDKEENTRNRIMTYILSVKKSENSHKTTSLIKIAKSTSKTQSILDFILYLSNKSKILFDILSKSRDIFYMIDAYESFIEDKYSDFSVDVATLEHDLSKGYYQLFLEDSVPSELESLEKWRTSREYFGFLYANYIAQKNSNSSFNEYLIMHQSRQIESLKAELAEIKKTKSELEEKKMKLGGHVSILLKLAKRYKNANIDIPPNIQELYNEIDFSLEQDDIEGEEISEDFEMDSDYLTSDHNPVNKEDKEIEIMNPEIDELELMETPIRFARIENNQLCIYTIKKPTISREMVNESLNTLRVLFPDVEETLLLEILKLNAFNVDEAANDLMDEERMAYYREHFNA